MPFPARREPDRISAGSVRASAILSISASLSISREACAAAMTIGRSN
jgi:hypothetical protein